MKKELLFLLIFAASVHALYDASGMKAGTSEEWTVGFYNGSAPIATGSCNITFQFPNNSVSFTNPMNYTTAGVYNYTWMAPSTPLGTWKVIANCSATGISQSFGMGLPLKDILDSEKLNQTLNNTAAINSTVSQINTTTFSINDSVHDIDTDIHSINTSFYGYLSQINSTTITIFGMVNGNFSAIQLNLSTVFSNLSTIRTELETLSTASYGNYTFFSANLTDLDLDLNSLVISSFSNFTIFRDNLTTLLTNVSLIINNTNAMFQNLSDLRTYDLYEFTNYTLTSFGCGSDNVVHGVEFANDEDLSTYWRRNGCNVGETTGLVLDMGRILPVSKIRFQSFDIPGDDDLGWVAFQISNDNINWKNIYNITTPLMVAPHEIFNIYFPTYNDTARYVRVVETPNTNSDHPTVAEWDVFTPNAALSYQFANETNVNVTQIRITLANMNQTLFSINDSIKDLDSDMHNLTNTVNGNFSFIAANLTDIDTDINSLYSMTNGNFSEIQDNLSMINANLSQIILSASAIQSSMNGNFSQINSSLSLIINDSLYLISVIDGNFTQIQTNFSQVNQSIFVIQTALNSLTNIVNSNFSIIQLNVTQILNQTANVSSTTIINNNLGGGGQVTYYNQINYTEAAYAILNVTGSNPFSSTTVNPATGFLGLKEEDYPSALGWLFVLILVVAFIYYRRNRSLEREKRRLEKLGKKKDQFIMEKFPDLPRRPPITPPS